MNKPGNLIFMPFIFALAILTALVFKAPVHAQDYVCNFFDSQDRR